MRFAGSAVENYLGSGPNMGALTQNSAVRDAERAITGFNSAAKIGGMGAQQLGSTLAQGAVSEAQAGLAGAQAQAQMMGSIGKLGGSLIGGLGSMGSSFAGNPGSMGVSGFGTTPSTQVAFGTGGGTHNGFGTFGPNWGY